jgi:Leucine-rich repeat (LRR) protein
LIVIAGSAGADATRLSQLSRDVLRHRMHVDPCDLSGLSQLDPNDLYQLRVSALVTRSDADRRLLEPISRLTGLQVLGLSQTGVTDTQVRYLGSLRSLRALELHQESALGNRGLAVLKDLPALEYLDLWTGATDAGLGHVGQLQSLRWLRLRMGRIRGQGLAELAKMPRLERLSLWGETGLSDRHISYLEGLTRLKGLTLWGTDQPLTDRSLASIAKLTSLEELYFIRIATQFSDAGLARLRSLEHLRKVDFGQSMVGDGGVRHLKALPQLESIEGGLHVTAEGMKTLASLPNLKCLHVGLRGPMQGYHGPTGVAELVRLKSLEELFIGGGQWSQEDLLVLGSLTSLKRLHLGMRVDMGDRAMAAIATLKDLEYLGLSAESVSKAGLNHLRGLTNLQTLSVIAHPEASSLIDETPLNLSTLTKLKTLDLRQMPLSDRDLASLPGRRDLEVLRVSGSFTEAAFQYLHDLPSVKFMDIQGIACPTGAGFETLRTFESLGDLKLRGEISDAALRQIPLLPGVWSFEAETEAVISDETVGRLRDCLPDLEYLYIREPRQFGGPRPVRIRGSDGRTGTRRQTPRRRR